MTITLRSFAALNMGCGFIRPFSTQCRWWNTNGIAPEILVGLDPPIGTLFQVHKSSKLQFQHYIGSGGVQLPPNCTSTFVNPNRLVKTTKEFLLNWDTQKLNSFQKVCEMDLWQAFFCNCGIDNRGSREISFKRDDPNTEFTIEVVGLNPGGVGFEWRCSIIIAGSVPILSEHAPLVSQLPFNWQKYEGLHQNKVHHLKHFGMPYKQRLNIQCENGFGTDNSNEDVDEPLDESYAKIYKLSMLNLNPFLAFGFSCASSISELRVLTKKDNSHRIITLKAASE